MVDTLIPQHIYIYIYISGHEGRKSLAVPHFWEETHKPIIRITHKSGKKTKETPINYCCGD